MPNPLRSEADAFRWVVVVVAGAVSVILLSALVGGTAGAVWAALLVGAAALLAWRRWRGSLTDGGRGGDGRHRLLVVVAEGADGEALIDEVSGRAEGRYCEVLVIMPAPRRAGTSGADEALLRTRQRMELAVIGLERHGLKARGEVGDSDPDVATADALRLFPADEVVVVGQRAD
jgi:hypothetical protein